MTTKRRNSSRARVNASGSARRFCPASSRLTRPPSSGRPMTRTSSRPAMRRRPSTPSGRARTTGPSATRSTRRRRSRGTAPSDARPPHKPWPSRSTTPRRSTRGCAQTPPTPTPRLRPPASRRRRPKPGLPAARASVGDASRAAAADHEPPTRGAPKRDRPCCARCPDRGLPWGQRSCGNEGSSMRRE